PQHLPSLFRARRRADAAPPRGRRPPETSPHHPRSWRPMGPHHPLNNPCFQALSHPLSPPSIPHSLLTTTLTNLSLRQNNSRSSPESPAPFISRSLASPISSALSATPASRHCLEPSRAPLPPGCASRALNGPS